MSRFVRLFRLVFCLLPLPVLAQKLEGKVIDASTGEPLFAAVIMLKDGSAGTTSDFDGAFHLALTSLPATIEIKQLGFLTRELVIESTAQPIVVRLEPDEKVLETVNVVGDRILEKQKTNPLTVESMDAIAVKEVPSGNFYEGLATMKGVDMASASLAFRVINTRGFNSTSPVRVLQLIDGVDNQSPGLNFSLGNFLGASDLDIKSVDVVQGASSAYFGPGAFNGVINMQTKNPFLSPGISASLKVGERAMVQPMIRWADVVKNKSGNPFLAYKINLFYLKANDWEARNYDPIYGSADGATNPGRFDAVNIYGDEYFGANDLSGAPGFSTTYRGLGTFYRNGYREEDLVDYKTENLKASAAIHLRLKPELDYESPELILQSNMGQGTTVYQGDNRFSLKNIFFMQNRLELTKKDTYFIRLYATHENAGNSYDPYFTAQKLRDEARSQEKWASAYIKYWQQYAIPRMNALDYPELTVNPNWPGPAADPDYSEYFLPYSNSAWMNQYQDSLAAWHQTVLNLTNNGNASLPGVSADGFYEPGSKEFTEAFNRITSTKNNEGEGGTRFYDRSALYNAQAEHQWNLKNDLEVHAGVSGRLYAPVSDGTIFIDTLERKITISDNGLADTTYQRNRIYNRQFGFYAGAEKKLLEDKLILSATVRVDKNQNFDALFSPAISAVYSPKKDHFVRLSISSALRNPTLADQYLNLNVGPATLRGNLDGVDSLITVESFSDYRRSQLQSDIRYFNIAPIKPEQARSIELGYRATLFDKVFVDASVYTTYYNDFIGYKLGISADFDTSGNLMLGSIRAFRYSANSDNRVITQGANLGVNYYFWKQHALSLNYSYNKLAKADDNDPIIPAFNTPLHKFNFGFNAHDIATGKGGNTWGYACNYKWVDTYFWEGSPQFTGPVPAFSVVDAQINFFLKKAGTTFKIGCSNLLNNEHIEAYGGPEIGRLAYFSVLYEWSE